jgi:uncharacterized protein
MTSDARILFRSVLRRVGFPVIIAGLVLAFLGVAHGKTRPAGDVRVLIVTGGHDFDQSGFTALFHSMPGISSVQLAYGQGAEEKLTPEGARDFDAIVFYDMHQEKDPQSAGIMRLLAQGKGMVFLHHSLWSYDTTWPEYRHILGGYASSKVQVAAGPSPTSTYLHGQNVQVHIADPSSPVTPGLQDFEIVDETYNHYWVDPKVHVLLTTDNPTSTHEIAWSHKYKKSRIVYIELGHGPTAYENPNYKILVRQAIDWVARGK